MTNITLRNNIATQSGGTLYMNNVDLNLEDSLLESNSANISGGSLFLECALHNIKRCHYDVQNSAFRDNMAIVSGGAIYYNLYSPESLDSSEFTHN